MKNDKQSIQTVQQAIKDDQALAAGSADIQVSIKEGTLTLEGHVASEKQLDLANGGRARRQ